MLEFGNSGSEKVECFLLSPVMRRSSFVCRGGYPIRQEDGFDLDGASKSDDPSISIDSVFNETMFVQTKLKVLSEEQNLRIVNSTVHSPAGSGQRLGGTSPTMSCQPE